MNICNINMLMLLIVIIIVVMEYCFVILLIGLHLDDIGKAAEFSGDRLYDSTVMNVMVSSQSNDDAI